MLRNKIIWSNKITRSTWVKKRHASVNFLWLLCDCNVPLAITTRNKQKDVWLLYWQRHTFTYSDTQSATSSLHWRHNGRNGVPNHQLHDCLLNRLFRRRSNNTSKVRVTGLCEGNSPVTGEFPAQRPVTRKMFPFDDVIMFREISSAILNVSWIDRWLSARPQ